MQVSRSTKSTGGTPVATDLLFFVDFREDRCVTWTKEVVDVFGHIYLRFRRSGETTHADGCKFRQSCCDSVAIWDHPMNSPLERRSLLDGLTSKGIRLTPQRRALIEVIQESREHLDAGSLLELARKRAP